MSQANQTTDTTASAPIDLEALLHALREVIDPEVGMNIVDLGLIYRVEASDDEKSVRVEMTMTSPACPMGEMIVENVEAVLRAQLPENVQAEVRLVWEPPWHPSMMSKDARAHYGW
ncbi:MIP18 family protein YitW [Sterolibacterium denitrificans]|uniref:MIP18 family protein YitW n=1 Tax=Sterolibacterium denitrificans TaxID=157592 RepID=A0A7Z7HSW0_9PROT|nr:metal-sulfur cluster assembly factor [Sterolibacterium denitrificans]SMB26019.1 MIP18 family protein YitW [Sterolibacterium denitrificans]